MLLKQAERSPAVKVELPQASDSEPRKNDLDEGRAEPNSPFRLAGKFLLALCRSIGSSRPPAGLPQGSAARSYCWSSLSAAGVSGANGSRGRGRGAERSEAERSPPCPPSMSFPVLSCLRSLLSPCLRVGREQEAEAGKNRERHRGRAGGTPLRFAPLTPAGSRELRQ